MRLSGFDYYDFGCSDGANIKYIQSIDPSIRGLGIDIDPKKIDKAREKKYEAITFDILKLPKDKMVRFVTMSHFLEHLSNLKMAEGMIRRGIDISHEFVFIRQPWFDSDGALLSHGLKFFWSDWTGHPNRMTSLDFYLILQRALKDNAICGFSIYGRTPVKTTADACLIPLGAPTDQHHYEPGKHGEKCTTKVLTLATYREIIVIAQIINTVSWKSLLEPLGRLYLLHSSGCM